MIDKQKTLKLKNKIEVMMNNVINEIDEDQIEYKLNILFSNGTPRNAEGYYAFCEQDIYYYVFRERGRISFEKSSTDIWVVLYLIIKDETYKIALQYATILRDEKKGFRRILFMKHLELIRLAEDSFFKKLDDDINDILQSAPYRDRV